MTITMTSSAACAVLCAFATTSCFGALPAVGTPECDAELANIAKDCLIAIEACETSECVDEEQKTCHERKDAACK